jgi:hypothetical protein
MVRFRPSPRWLHEGLLGEQQRGAPAEDFLAGGSEGRRRRRRRVPVVRSRHAIRTAQATGEMGSLWHRPTRWLGLPCPDATHCQHVAWGQVRSSKAHGPFTLARTLQIEVRRLSRAKSRKRWCLYLLAEMPHMVGRGYTRTTECNGAGRYPNPQPSSW